ncbi:MAG: magnesium transporter [Candidatus Woesearchaeota archaeon]
MHQPLDKYILKKVPIVHEQDTIQSVLAMMQKKSNTYDRVDFIYVINAKDALIGVFSVRQLFSHPKHTKVKTFVHKHIFSGHSDMTLDEIAHIALKHNLKQVPIKEGNHLVGVVSAREIMSTLNHSLRHDIMSFAGIHNAHVDFDNTLEVPIKRLIGSRIPWLLLGLLGAIFIAGVIHIFEDTLATYVIIAAFIPTIIYISDALSSQTLTIFIRDMAVLGKRMHLWSYIGKQALVAFFMAIIIGLVMFSVISLFWQSPHIAFVISLATFCSLLTTSTIAFFIALLIKKFKFDPALGSGPIATVIADLTSVLIYFTIVILLL